MTRRYRIEGMTCDGCARSVGNAIRTAAPKVDVDVDLAKGIVTVSGAAEEPTVRHAVEDAGFRFIGAVDTGDGNVSAGAPDNR